MVSKNNKKLIAEKNRRNEKQRFTIRKLNVGVASVLLGITFSIYGGGQVIAHADTVNTSDQVAASDTGDNSLAEKSEVALSSAASSTSQPSASATSANGTVQSQTSTSANSAAQSQTSANNQTATPATTPASDSAAASNATVEATKDQSAAKTQSSASQEAKTTAQPVAQENGSEDAGMGLEGTQQVLNTITNSNSIPEVNYLASFAAASPASSTATEAEDPNAITVTDADGLINAIQTQQYTTINIGADISLGSKNHSFSGERGDSIRYKRDITIQSANNNKYKVDFNSYAFTMNSDNAVTFKNLDLYGRSWFGLVQSAGTYNFDDVDYHGSQMVYSTRTSQINFSGTVNAATVNSYVFDDKTYNAQNASDSNPNPQQVIEFRGGTSGSNVNFKSGSNVTLSTVNGNPIQLTSSSGVNVENGATVTLNPHTANRRAEGSQGGVAHGIYANGGAITIGEGGRLTVNTEKGASDSAVSGGIYLNTNSSITIENGGNLTINSDGQLSRTDGQAGPLYVYRGATINVGNGASFNINATNLGNFAGDLLQIDGSGTVNMKPHSNFKITGDGTGAVTAVSLSGNSTFTSDQPARFIIDLSQNTNDNKALIKNGVINFTRVKTADSKPLGQFKVTYDKNGNVASYTITAQDENTVKQVAAGLTNKSLIDLTKAGEDVALNNLHIDKNNHLTGIVESSGTDDPIYVTVTINGNSINIPVAGNYTVYTDTDGNITSTNTNYSAITTNNGKFDIDLSNAGLKDTDTITVNATKDFVEAAPISKTVAALRALNTTTLKELVDAAPDEEKKASYYNASEEAQKAYTDAISKGQNILNNPNNYDQVDVDNAVTAIQNAQKALTGEPTNKTDLQVAVDDASTVESSDNYTNADADLQKAYTDAISEGQTVLSNASATQTEVSNALTKINTAKEALNGDAKKAASKEALQKAVEEASTVKSDDAAYYNGSDEAKTAYDNAISAGQKVLDNSDATATQITDALTAINTAKSNLNGKTTDKSALQTAVDNSATVKESNNYTNADEAQKTAYDDAVTKAQTVLGKTNATQAEVNQALQDLETANNNLNGDAKTEAANKAALEVAVKDAPNVRNTPAFYNGSDEAQTEYNNAINAGQAVLDQANPSASDVKSALDAINTAKANLKGEATNTAALETALTNANNAKETGNYTNADQAKQEALNNAITAGQDLLTKTKVTQAEVVNAARAITDAISNLNGDTNLEKAKTAATEDIQKALDTKTTEITDATNIDQATKDQLIADAKKAAEDANTAINQATDGNAVNTAKTEGITNINNVTVPSLDDAKTNAAKEIDQALTDKTKEINNAENIDQTTKDQLIKEATDAANTAKDAIEKATTNDDVATEQAKGIDAINNVKVPSVTDSQNAAKEVIDDALNAKTKEINDANNIDQTTKDQLIKEATDAANNAKEAIDKATTADAIKTAQDEGTTNINNVTVPSLEDAKKAATKAVEDALTAQTKVINSATNLSDAEKKNLIDRANDVANATKDNIEKSTTNNAATQAGQDGVEAIKKIVPTSLESVKTTAKEAIEKALTEKLSQIDSASALTTDEKDQLIQEANTDANKAIEEITNATTNDAVNEAKDNGVNAINGIDVPTSSTVKEQATTDLNTAVENAKKAIDQDSNLTDEEKQAAKNQIDSEAKNAQEAIDNSTTNDDVKNALNDGKLAIDKDVANAAIDNAVAGKKDAISKTPLTDEEKTTLNNEVDQKATAAKDTINAATTPEAVATAQDNGVNNINETSVPSDSAVKRDAKEAIAKVANEKNAAIESSNLTDEEKAALKQKVTEAQTAADQAIDNATTNAAVTEAEDKGVKAIENITVPTTSANKEKAITDLNTAVDEAKNAIDQDNNLTDEQKQAAKDQIDSDAKTAQEAINSATTDNDVNNALNNGKVSINKEVANAAIDNAAAGKLKEIKDPLTNEEQQTYTDLINSEANNAKQNIADATTVEEVTAAQNSGVDAINKIEVPTTSTVKDNAIKAIDKALQNKTDEINSASNLNSQEKADLINQATKAADTAKDNINNATTNADVKTAQTNGEKAIADVTVPNLSDVKKESIDLINKALDAKADEINNASNLSQDEKQSLINDATNAATEAINNVNQSQTNDEAKAAASTGVQNIENVNIPSLDEVKKNANQAIDDALKSKVDEINNASNLNETEKKKLVDQATEAANTAKDNVEKATTNDDVRDAANTGIENIKGITFTSLEDAKDAANTAIDNALKVKTDEINNASNLSSDEKQDIINQATEAAKNAKDNINNATTNDAVTAAQNKGITDIANVTVPSLDQVKQAAIDAIKQVQEAKNKQIAAASNLSAEEQKALTDQVDQIANDAIAKINDASMTTNDAVTATRDDAIKQITDLFIPTLDGAQTDAINAIESAKNAKISNINNAAHLTDQEKQDLIDQTNKAADDATKAIKDAQTNDAVKSAETAGLEDINNVTIPTLAEKQQEAIEELNAARDAKNNAIDNATDLTTDEKNNLKDKVQAEYSNAVANVTGATTDQAVTIAKENGINAINDVKIPTKSATKDQATTDLNTAVDEAKKAIDQDSNLTDEQKQAAKDQIDSDAKKAQEAIDNAKTDDEVNTAVDNGKLAIDKDVANAAIDNAVAGKKAEIAKAPLTTDEAKTLNDLVDQEAKAAKNAINSATTISAVEDAKKTGVTTINDIAVPTTSSAKDQANQTIDDALANKTKEINDATNLSDKQKQDLIDQANDEAAKAKENIKNATSDEAVNKATTDGVDAIANVTIPSLDDAKKDASQVIDDVLKQKEDEINNASHLTDQEKQDLINQAQNAADEAKDKINQATTNDDVAMERDAGAEKIANIVVPSLDDAKDKATKAIDDALADKTKEINDQTHLSDQEKNDLIKQITDIANKAKDKINNDSNDAEIAKDEKDGIDAIVDTKVPGLEDHKQNAIKSLDEAKSTKLAQIDEAAHLTADEKANLTQQVDAEYNKALANINKATTNDDADKASADGVEAILNIAVPSLNEKKQDSIDALNEVREAKKEEINNANNLSQDEKDELTKQVDQIADNAINAINGAKDDQTAKDAENKGIQDILDVKVPSLDEVKTNAKQAIADALESKTNEINAASNLDSATKQELINRANVEADTAIEKIDQATSNDQALAASQAGIDKILGIEVPTLADAKQSAIDAINDALKQKETEINNASQLTSDEKQGLINQVNSIADNAKDAINNATTNQSVEEAKNAGIEKINAVNVPTTSATKDEAIKAIDDALTNKVNEINNATNITAEEKANLIDEANNAANTAKDKIDQATSDSEVTTATTDGINAIANITVPSLETAKDQAKNLIDDVLNEKKNEINNADNLSDSQKQDLINQATDEADQAKKNIDNATTNNGVQTAEDNGAQAIENVTVPSLEDAKETSTKVIDEVLKEKTAEINAATNISNTEKDALIEEATTAANTAKDNIAKATTNDAVKVAETDGVKAILDIKVPSREDQQKNAIAALNRALADKVSEINNANNLSETMKQDLKQQAQVAYTTAVDNVNNAQTNAEIDAARDNGVQAILDVTVPTLTDTQDASITAVEQVRDAKKTQIEAAKNLTETQREALKNQVDEIADKAIDNIKNATTDVAVKNAETTGINEILNVTIPTLDAAKSDAKQAITDALTAKTAEINAAQNLTDAEKQKLIDQAQAEATAANKNIDAATTNEAAELAAKNGVQAILDIQVPTVEETRDQAKKNIDDALNSKKEETNNSNLSPAAKEALINEAEQAAENARTAIDNATTASAINEAEAAGIAAIENIKVASASAESGNPSNQQTNTETPTEGNSTSSVNNNATQASVQGNSTQTNLTGSQGTKLTTGQQSEKATGTNSKETLPQTGNETERGLSIAGLAIASLLGLFGLSGLGKKRD